MRSPKILLVDALINLILGVPLATFPKSVVDLLGDPHSDAAFYFYPSILGAVLFGIGIALLEERHSGRGVTTGLGLMGAVTINLCGGIVLAGWLLVGELTLPLRGMVFLWTLVVLLLCLSGFELIAELRRRRGGCAI